jgi:hypothetical protein
VQAAVLDFFTELCTSELDRLEDRLHVEHYTAQSTQTLVPILLEVLTMSKGNGDEMDELQDVWKISFQSLTLLGLISQLVSLDEQAKYNFASQIMPFVSEYSLSDTWQLRKAALLAYGAIVTTGVIETDALQVRLYFPFRSPWLSYTTEWLNIGSINTFHYVEFGSRCA